VAAQLLKSRVHVVRSAIQEGIKLMRSLSGVLSIGASGIAAQRTRAEVLVENLANAETNSRYSWSSVPRGGMRQSSISN
jgi:hypothetical protein